MFIEKQFTTNMNINEIKKSSYYLHSDSGTCGKNC